MMNRFEMTDKDMELVSGGNYGDSNLDNGEKPMYSVGQEIELYNTVFHVTTTHCRIYGAKKLDDSYWAYSIDPDDPDGETGNWIYADDIENNAPEGSW